MPKISPIIRGACGEHYAASYLSGMGLVVALTRAGTPTTDLIVTSEAGGRSVSLQVKTGGIDSHVIFKKTPKNNYWNWRSGSKAAELSNESHWYAFVFIGDWPSGGGPPKVFFVPSKFVAERAHHPDTSEGWFWMSDAEAEQFHGLDGYEKLAKVLAG